MVAAESSATDAAAQSTVPQASSMDGAKIGIIVGVVIVAFLSLVALGFCIFDGRRRLNRWRENKRTRIDSEVNMWETQLRNGQSRKRDSNPRGLWDGLRVDRDTAGAQPAGGQTGPDPILETTEQRGRNVGMATRVGETRSQGSRMNNGGNMKKVETVQRRTPGAEPAWVQAYMPRDRTSVVSAGSLGIPIVAPPVAARSFLDR